MVGPASGNSAPKRDRETVIAAMPDAAYRGYESMIYVCKVAKRPTRPKAKGKRPTMGTIQCVSVCIDQPYQKNDTGTEQAKKMQSGSRISGSKTPLLWALSRTMALSLSKPKT